MVLVPDVYGVPDGRVAMAEDVRMKRVQTHRWQPGEDELSELWSVCRGRARKPASSPVRLAAIAWGSLPEEACRRCGATATATRGRFPLFRQSWRGGGQRLPLVKGSSHSSRPYAERRLIATLGRWRKLPGSALSLRRRRRCQIRSRGCTERTMLIQRQPAGAATHEFNRSALRWCSLRSMCWSAT